jgi:hypothetical protein
MNAEPMTWSSTEYAAGFEARFLESAACEDESLPWRCGWEDAHIELLAAEQHRQRIAKGEVDDYEETWSLLFDAGGDARVNGIPFDEKRTQPWKEGWVDADINFGVSISRA